MMKLQVPKAPKRVTRPRDELDDFLSSDLEVSFASSMSLNSPPRLSPGGPAHRPPSPMDISPAPRISRTRGFGKELSNTVHHDFLARSPLPAPPASLALTKAGGTTGANKGRQRAAIPDFWMQAPTTPDDVAAMDIDSPLPPARVAESPIQIKDDCYIPASSRAQRQVSPLPQSRKRRSTEPEPEHELSLSSDHELPSSPLNCRARKFERFASSGTVFVVPSGPTPKRNRRPALSTLLPASQDANLVSAYPILSQSTQVEHVVSAIPPVRRTLSAVVPSSIASQFECDQSASSSDDSFMNSSPAVEYAKRNDQRVLKRKDGKEEFRPKHGAGALQLQMNSSPRVTMPPFGHEAFGKVLPCRAVREDGLMRIDTSTLADLMRGAYSSEIASFQIFDCRFEYEFQGGHIAGAFNINSAAAIEERLLKQNGLLPKPSSSGDGSGGKVILIFHCEFSKHRAPTIAKHLRARDRALNNHIYPKVHYPEVYILDGGYCQFYNDYPECCQPNGYVRMDDPTFSKSRDTDMDNFRKGKWGRTRSYTYGEPAPSRSRPNSLSALSQSHRNTAPGAPSGGHMFAAANAARLRRGGTLDEALAAVEEHDHDHDHDADTSGSAEHGIDESPCPTGGSARIIGARLTKAFTLPAF